MSCLLVLKLLLGPICVVVLRCVCLRWCFVIVSEDCVGHLLGLECPAVFRAIVILSNLSYVAVRSLHLLVRKFVLVM